MSNPMAKVWRVYGGAKIPIRMTEGSVGYDLCAAEDHVIEKGAFGYINTGIVVKPPEGYHTEIALRSSMPKKRGLLIPNGMGIIDSDYSSEGDIIKVPVFKFGRGSEDTYLEPHHHPGIPMISTTIIREGDRIAQLIFRKTHLVHIYDYTGMSFEGDSRGGLGSTGDE